MRKSEPAHSIVESLGGKVAVAEALNLRNQSIDYWTKPVSRRGSGGRIPGKYHRALIELAREKGVALSYEDFHADGKPASAPKA